MTEIDRMRARVAGWRPDRRNFVAIGLGVTAWVASEVAKEVLFDTAKEIVAAEPVVEPFVESNLMPLFDRYASASQRAALAAWEDGVDVIDRLGEICEDRRYAVIDFGRERASYCHVGSDLSVINPGMVGTPVLQAPTPEYGHFVFRRAKAVWMSGTPAFAACAGRLTGKRPAVNYTALMLPVGDRVVSVGKPVAPRAVPQETGRRDVLRLAPSARAVAI
ncbi:MAG: hypothetical protein ACMVO3_22575 [Thalassobaculum sp.]